VSKIVRLSVLVLADELFVVHEEERLVVTVEDLRDDDRATETAIALVERDGRLSQTVALVEVGVRSARRSEVVIQAV
jgi:hypothetical protein